MSRDIVDIFEGRVSRWAWRVRWSTRSCSRAAVRRHRAAPSDLAKLGIRLLARYREGGYAALEPRSRRPRTSPGRTSPELASGDRRAAGGARGCRPRLRPGDDRGAPRPAGRRRSVGGHDLAHPESARTDHAQPHKRPRSSFIRFEAALPNELWQADTTHWRLADGTDVEILDLVDDHSRLLLAADAFRTVKAADVVGTFRAAADGHGLPAALLTDNGAVFTGRPRGGKVLLETGARAPRHRRQALDAEPSPDLRQGRAFPPDAQALSRPSAAGRQPGDPPGPARRLPRLLQRRATAPSAGRGDAREIFATRIKARPVLDRAPTWFRVRQDRVSKAATSPCAT